MNVQPRVPMDKDEEEPLLDERELLGWIARRGVVVVPVITKSDKLAKHERAIVAERLRVLWSALPVLFSATTGEGRERLLGRLLAGTLG